MRNYTNDKYTYFVADKQKKVVAVSTYAGKIVRGVAKCDPRDEFSIETGKKLAAARCNLKVATKRAKRAAIRTELGIPDDAIVLLSVGEVNENKNHRVVIEALGKLEEKNVHYIVCGRGELEESHKNLAAQLGLTGRVHLTGYRNDVADFYQVADIFVFPSLREGLPVAVMEAMASGLPIVCNDIRGCADLIEDGVNGTKMKECKSEAYATVIATYLERNACQLVSKKNQQKARGFDLHTVSEQYKQIYEAK